jgi:hypothetical protein
MDADPKCPPHRWHPDGIYPDEHGAGDPRHPDTQADAGDSPVLAAVKAYDRQHGTGHRYGYLACELCGAWREDTDGRR